MAELDISIDKVLAVHATKYRVVLSGVYRGEKVVVKWNSPLAVKHLELLRREQEFLNSRRGLSYTPELIAGGSDHLVLKAYSAQSLRNWLIREQRRGDVIDQTFTSTMERLAGVLGDIVATAGDEVPLGKAAADLIPYGHRLLSSGPAGTTRSKANAIAVRLLMSGSMAFGHAALARRLESTGYTSVLWGVCHRDLHLNNVLVSETGLHVIDWEKVSVGSPLGDCLYSLTMIDLLLRARPRRRTFVHQVVRAAIRERDERTARQLDALLPLFGALIAANDRFYEGEPVNARLARYHAVLRAMSPLRLRGGVTSRMRNRMRVI